ncbi:MAG: alpha/beta fold hydrolase [Pseudomonadota bacterium]
MPQSTFSGAALPDRRRESPPIGSLAGPPGGRMHYLSMGVEDGDPPVVVLHGASGNLRDAAFSLMPALAPHRHVIAVDRPGFGHSDRVPGAVSLRAQVTALRAGLEALGHRTVHLVAHSYGGAVALAWALAEPREVASLTLIGGVAMDWGGAISRLYHLTAAPVLGAITAQAAALAPRRYVEAQVKAIFAPAEVPEGYMAEGGVDLALRPTTFRLNARQIVGVHAEVISMMPHYGAIACPVTLIHGDADHVVPMSIHAEGLAAQIPQAQLIRIAGAGHMPHHSHTAQVAQAILDQTALAGQALAAG